MPVNAIHVDCADFPVSMQLELSGPIQLPGDFILRSVLPVGAAAENPPPDDIGIIHTLPDPEMG